MAVATTHVAYSRMAVTDVLLTLAITCVLALAIDGRLEWAGLVVGLAASAKYPGAIAAVPVVVAGWGRWRALGRAAALGVAGFALTSPFVLIHAGSALGRRHAGATSRTRRLARVRERPDHACRLPRSPLGGNRPPRARRRCSRCCGARSPYAGRPRAALVRSGLLADPYAAGGALRSLRPAARAGARGDRRELPDRRSGCPRRPRRSARVGRLRHARAHAHRHAAAGRRVGCRQRASQRPDRGRPVDAASAREKSGPARAPGPGPRLRTRGGTSRSCAARASSG